MKSQSLDMTGVGTSNTPPSTVTSDAGAGRKLTVDELRAWLNRPPPLAADFRRDERPWEDFELDRVLA